MYLCVGYISAEVHVWMLGQLVGVLSLYSSGAWGLNLGHQAWWQVSLQAEPSQRHLLYIELLMKVTHDH